MSGTVIWNGAEWEARIRAGAMQGVIAGIGIVEKRAVELLTQGPWTGVVYRRRGVVHQASAPGEPPASDTGTLVNAREIRTDSEELSATLNFTSKHAPYLQWGTRHIEPRPFADRALLETRDQVLDVIRANVAAAVGL